MTPAPSDLSEWHTAHWLAASRDLMNRGPAVLLHALKDFANTGDTPDSVFNFLKNHPGLMGFPYCYPTVVELTLHFVEHMKKSPATGFPNCDPTVAELALPFVEGMKEPPATTPEVAKAYQDGFAESPFFRFRDRLRQVWSGGDTKGLVLAELLSLIDPLETNGLEDPETLIRQRWRILPDWRKGSLQYRPRNAFERACFVLLENSRHAKVCARAECSSPFFIAGRTTQRYCGTDCADAMQDEWRREWWREKGNEWRKRRKSAVKAKTKRGKG